MKAVFGVLKTDSPDTAQSRSAATYLLKFQSSAHS